MPPRGVPIFHPVKCEEMTDGIPFSRICSVPKKFISVSVLMSSSVHWVTRDVTASCFFAPSPASPSDVSTRRSESAELTVRRCFSDVVHLEDRGGTLLNQPCNSSHRNESNAPQTVDKHSGCVAL